MERGFSMNILRHIFFSAAALDCILHLERTKRASEMALDYVSDENSSLHRLTTARQLHETRKRCYGLFKQPKISRAHLYGETETCRSGRNKNTVETADPRHQLKPDRRSSTSTTEPLFFADRTKNLNAFSISSV